MADITLKITNVKGQAIENISVQYTTPLREIKSIVHERWGTSLHVQKLNHRGTLLTDDNKALGDYIKDADRKGGRLNCSGRGRGRGRGNGRGRGSRANARMELMLMNSGTLVGGRKIIPGATEVAHQLRFMQRAQFVDMHFASEDEMKWLVTMKGPARTPYQDGWFEVEFVFPTDYPYQKPSVKFLTKIFHPNVWPDGSLCYNDLDNVGVCFADVLITAIKVLLAIPNPKSPANPAAAQIFSNDREEFNRVVKTWVNKHALV